MSSIQNVRGMVSGIFTFLANKMWFVSEESKKLQELDAKIRKLESEAETMLRRLYHNRHTMCVRDQIEALWKIHDYHNIPLYRIRDGSSLRMLFYCMMSEMHHSPCVTQEDADRLLRMLFWNEIKKLGDCSPRFLILDIVSRFPTKSAVAKLIQHRLFLEDARSLTEIGTHHYADLCHEIMLMERLIVACEQN